MKVYDISQEVYTSATFPGDPVPEKEILMNMAEGDMYNISKFTMCVHNGTHIDAPYHFISDGKKIDELDLSMFVGSCFVVSHDGEVTEEDAMTLMQNLMEENPEAAKRILFKGATVVTAEAAAVLASFGVYLVGNEAQTVGPEDAPKAVHDILLGSGAVLLEGIRLGEIQDGAYILNAAPINLGGSDGAPCRAILFEDI